MKIGIIVGTRPEAIKLLPVYIEFKKGLAIDPVLISTGQHTQMLTQIFDIFDVKPDYELQVMEPDQSLAMLSSRLFVELDNILKRVKCKALIVQGDTASCMVASLVGYYHTVKILHVEAGLRTFNNFSPFPEEVNRRITSIVADLHCAPTTSASKNLADELKNYNPQIVVTGNTVIDSLLFVKNKISKEQEIVSKSIRDIASSSQKIILITGHRRENIGHGLVNLCDAILELSNSYPQCDFVFPVHLNPSVKGLVHQKLAALSNVHLLPPLNYIDMVYLTDKSYLIISDSGGIQEEAPTLNKPILVTREYTERQEGVDAGCAILCGIEKEDLISYFNQLMLNHDLYFRMAKSPNPYGDGNASKRIVALTEQLLFNQLS